MNLRWKIIVVLLSFTANVTYAYLSDAECEALSAAKVLACPRTQPGCTKFPPPTPDVCKERAKKFTKCAIARTTYSFSCFDSDSGHWKKIQDMWRAAGFCEACAVAKEVVTKACETCEPLAKTLEAVGETITVGLIMIDLANEFNTTLDKIVWMFDNCVDDPNPALERSTRTKLRKKAIAVCTDAATAIRAFEKDYCPIHISTDEAGCDGGANAGGYNIPRKVVTFKPEAGCTKCAAGVEGEKARDSLEKAATLFQMCQVARKKLSVIQGGCAGCIDNTSDYNAGEYCYPNSFVQGWWSGCSTPEASTINTGTTCIGLPANPTIPGCIWPNAPTN